MRWVRVTALCALAIVMGAVLGCVGTDLPPLADDGGVGPCKLGEARLGECVLQK
jgi:hypothetical protein